MSHSLRAKVATSPAEIRALLEVRHTSGSAVDLFDALPTTTHLVAVRDGHVWGGVRLTVDSPAGLPSDAHFEFRTTLPARAKLAACSMLCLLDADSAADRLPSGMMRMCVYWAHVHELSHLCALMDPGSAPLLERIGFVPVAEVLQDEHDQPLIPLVLDLAAMSWDFRDFVRRQDVGLWLDSFERAFFDTGQPIVTEGERGDEAYLVVDGTAHAVAHGDDAAGRVVARFTPGQVFGELALLTDRPRSTTVIAATPTDVMVLRRELFQRQIASNPDLAIEMMRAIGDRFHDTVTGSAGAE